MSHAFHQSYIKWPWVQTTHRTDFWLTGSESDTTARSAFNRGFETWLVSDACGSANKAQHQAGLRGFGFAFGDVLTTEEALERLKKDGVYGDLDHGIACADMAGRV